MTKLYLSLLLSAAMSLQAFAEEASYDHPTALRHIGTIENPRVTPACSYLTRNPMNQGAFLWTPVGSTVMYTDTSTGAPTAWSWSCDGATPGSLSSQDAVVAYNTVGTYAFPTEEVSYGSTVQTVSPEWKLKVGGTAELCLSDTRVWLKTYALGIRYYDNGINGVLGGANKRDIEGVGNLYYMPGDEIYLDGVNVYLAARPQKWPEGRRISVAVYLVNITQDGVKFTDQFSCLESAFIDYDDIKTKDDGYWVPVGDGAVIPVKFQNPVDLYGKPAIFITVSGWGFDPSKEDFAILSDIFSNAIIKTEDASNLLAHDSFARLKGETDYMRPISYYGGDYGSFMICPVVRGYETPLSGTGSIDAVAGAALQCSVSGQTAAIAGADGAYAVYSVAGALQHSGTIEGGYASFGVGTWAKGVYIVRDSQGHTAKFIVR